MNRPVVVYAYPPSNHYRVPFHIQLREELDRRGVTYRYVYARNPNNLGKGDTLEIDWAEATTARFPLGPARKLIWHSLGQAARDADLLILQQENAILSNYFHMIRSRLGGPRIGLFGHGRNFQALDPESLGERWKRVWSRRVDWWFTYTERSARGIEAFGFAPSRITVFNNSIDLTTIQQQIASVDDTEVAKLRAALVQGSNHVGVYVGGIYAEKRIPFLIDCVDRVREIVPDFHFIVMGAGPEADLLKSAAADRPWLHYLGPKFNEEKALYLALSRVWLMPGLVGLAVLDSFAFETPMVTTDIPYHSPEIDYLEDGVNGVIVRDADDIEAYSNAVAKVLTDRAWHAKLVTGGREALSKYSIEAMVQRFADGVMSALETPR